MNLRDLLEEFFTERGYHKIKEHTWGSTTHWDIVFSKGTNEDVIQVKGDIDNPSEIVITAYKHSDPRWGWNNIWLEEINVNDPDSLNCLDKALRR
jgi:hypothetical protein